MLNIIILRKSEARETIFHATFSAIANSFNSINGGRFTPVVDYIYDVPLKVRSLIVKDILNTMESASYSILTALSANEERIANTLETLKVASQKLSELSNDVTGIRRIEDTITVKNDGRFRTFQIIE